MCKEKPLNDARHSLGNIIVLVKRASNTIREKRKKKSVKKLQLTTQYMFFASSAIKTSA